MRAMFDGFNCRVVARNYSTIQWFKSSTLNGLRKLKLGFAKSQISLIFPLKKIYNTLTINDKFSLIYWYKNRQFLFKFAFVNYHLIWISAQK